MSTIFIHQIVNFHRLLCPLQIFPLFETLADAVFNYAVLASVITQGGSVYSCLLDYRRTEFRIVLIACGEFSAFASLKPICQFFLKYTLTYTALGPFAA